MSDVLFVHSSDELYGADRMLLEQVAALPADVRAEVWVPTDVAHPEQALCHELERRGVPVRHVDLPILRRAYRRPRALAALGLRALRLLALLRRRSAELVYCTTSAAFVVAPLARIASRSAMVVGHVQEIWTVRDRQVLGRLARCCHRILTISPAVSDALPPRLRAGAVVVANGTPEPAAAPPVDALGGALTFVVASRWNAWKGHGTLLRAWDAMEDGRLVVLGGPPPSGPSTDVRALVAGLRRPESVDVVGEVADPSAHLVAADVVLVPSDGPEPFGLVAIEAFARRRPVVASDAGGLRDIVSSDVDGWRFPAGDAESLATVLRSLTREAVAAAGERARATYERRFTVAQYGVRWRAALGLDGRTESAAACPTAKHRTTDQEG